MVVLDLSDNKLYFADIGKIWRCDESPNYAISLMPLEDEHLYSFGSIAGSKGFIQQPLQNATIDQVINAAKLGILMQHVSMPQYVGNIGSHLVNITGGDKPVHFFTSCYSSLEDLLDNVLIS